MAATREDIDRWIITARQMNAKHIISVCDTFDWDDYPVYVMPNEDLEEKKKFYNGHNMQKINEVITLNDDSVTVPGIKNIFRSISEN